MAGNFAKRLKVPAPEVLRIVKLGSNGFFNLLHAAGRNLTMTERFKGYFVPSLLKTVSHYGLVSLSAPQVSNPTQVIVVHKNPEPDKWQGYTSTESDYDIYMNPKIIEDPDLHPTLEDSWETCPSLSHLEALCTRKSSILMTYKTLEGEEEKSVANGFKARVIQHEVDHLNGFLMLLTPISLGRIKANDEIMKQEVEKYQVEIERRKNLLNQIYEKNLRFRMKVDRSGMDKESAVMKMTFTKVLNAHYVFLFNNALMKERLEVPDLDDKEFGDIVREFKV